MHKAPVIWINGWPGVGKNTVAECLGLLLGNDKATIVDDQYLNQTTLPPHHSHPDYEQAHSEAREAALAKFVEDRRSLSRVAIFSECQPDTPEGKAVAHEYEVAARRAGRLLIPVYLTCSVEENNRRLQTLERKVSQRDKIRSPVEAHGVRAQGGGALFVFPGRPGLTLDVTKVAPHETAVQILTFMHDLIAQREGELAAAEATPVDGQEPDWPRLGAT
ncbi:hypothetical protein NKR23_g3890 [Pleurostoma richardsiae]|uniref:Uncharacterized protein n=1 Tax=Pleurostoma richardsiae TaxID=41990 RepID=A0AA38VGQ8_9PEZI|nr:hypothetical protein NKR23_g3890 [Pleurostoma richardsiae]